MKTIASTILIFMVILSCQQPSDEANQPAASSIFTKDVGDQIPASLGLRWIAEHQRQLTGARDAQVYKVTQANLEAMMQSTSNLVGFTFHHALDDAGKHHVIIIPMDDLLHIWTSPSQRIVIDANTDTEVSMTTAREWIENYRKARPQAIRYHFFGADVFQEIVQREGFEIREAINDQQIPQLLVVVQVTTEAADGRVSTEEQMFDITLACPKDCAIE